VQTLKLQNVGIGKVHIEYITGKLIGTEIEPDRYPEGWRLFTGLHVAISPAFLPGLRIGLNRSFIANQQDLKRTSDYFPLFQPFQKNKLGEGTDGSGSAPDDQRISGFFDWRFSKSGLRTYAEFGREDHNMDLRDAFLEPNHIRAYQMGVEKVSQNFRMNVEFTQMQVTMVNKARPQAPWYTYTGVRRGYTHEGQVLGSGVGPGGSSLFFQFERTFSNAKAALFLERAEREGELIQYAADAKEVDYMLGIRHRRTFERLEFIPEIEYMHTQNRYSVKGNTVNNLALRIQLRYRL